MYKIRTPGRGMLNRSPRTQTEIWGAIQSYCDDNDDDDDECGDDDFDDDDDDIDDEYAGDSAFGNRDVDEDGLAWL